MTKLLIASLFTLACSATSADTSAPQAPRQPPPPPPPAAGCVAGTLGGSILFEIDHRSDVKDLPTGAVQVATDGSWHVVHVRDGKIVGEASGCITADQLRTLTAALASATWKPESPPADRIRCMAYSAAYDVYQYKGKAVMTHRMCDGFDPDAATTKALSIVLAIVKPLDAAAKP